MTNRPDDQGDQLPAARTASEAGAAPVAVLRSPTDHRRLSDGPESEFLPELSAADTASRRLILEEEGFDADAVSEGLVGRDRTPLSKMLPWLWLSLGLLAAVWMFPWDKIHSRRAVPGGFLPPRPKSSSDSGREVATLVDAGRRDEARTRCRALLAAIENDDHAAHKRAADVWAEYLLLLDEFGPAHEATHRAPIFAAAVPDDPYAIHYAAVVLYGAPLGQTTRADRAPGGSYERKLRQSLADLARGISNVTSKKSGLDGAAIRQWKDIFHADEARIHERLWTISNYDFASKDRELAFQALRKIQPATEASEEIRLRLLETHQAHWPGIFWASTENVDIDGQSRSMKNLADAIKEQRDILHELRSSTNARH